MIVVLVLLMAGLAFSSITCPDGRKCQDKNTCCQTTTGYACCPYPSAVCCPDKSHCCPQDFQCNLETQMCEKNGMPWYRFNFSPLGSTEEPEESIPPPSVQSGNPAVLVVHCDNYKVCPDGTTCCRSPQGLWYCCIYNMGQCCPDGYHCCPHGYHCDITSTHCLSGTRSLPSSPKSPAMLSNTTQDQCCMSETGCCPNGFHCDEKLKSCVSDLDQSTPVVPLKQALDLNMEAGVIRCSGRFYCPAENTCCKTLTGQWACCPYTLGQCCKDGKHCCEYGYDCDSTFTKCKKQYSSIPASPKKKALIL